MRPEVLFSLFKPVTSLTGIGPRTGKLIERLVGANLVNLLWHLPCGVIDRRYAPCVADARSGTIATMTLEVGKHKKPPNKRLPYKVYCSDGTGTLVLVFFHAHEEYLKKALPEGKTRVVSGKVEVFGKEIQITHPDHIGNIDELDELRAVEPIYPLTTGLTLKMLGKAVTAALGQVPALDEWVDPAYVERQGWRPWLEALLEAHAPDGEAALEPSTPARARLAYDELFANQLALALVRRNMRRLRGRAIAGDGRLRRKVVAELPFQLTVSQESALGEIATDMANEARMLRLLHGDVGSGKTVVALLAMLNAIESGGQAVVMAPTEILARQHLATIEPLANAAGITAALLTGREKGKSRKVVLDGLENGDTNIVVGTHALFQDDVIYNDLALAVIDEQHRFGVHQRLTLAGKGRAVDILVMTATPIPRTLMLTAYGDMDVSRMLNKPAGRLPVDTRVLPIERLEAVTAALARSVTGGAQAFWVCPLIAESEAFDVAPAEDRHAALQARFGDSVGLVHGRMKEREKEAAMAAFVGGDIDILVATTVIEVGVDVPKASVMVVEHAERFGLAQLHQLRGRIGRGDKPATCLLLYAQPLTETALARLKILRQTDDGFQIAEEDLRLRGAGELMGSRQSGLPEFHLANLSVHSNLLTAAREHATVVLERDPELVSKRGQAIRTLLYLFERDAAVRKLRSG